MSKDKVIGDKWSWLTDYVYAISKWTLHVEEGRIVEVGTGVSFRGRPLGARHRNVSRHKVFETWGVGAIHVRVKDGKGPCRIRLDQGEIAPIRITREF